MSEAPRHTAGNEGGGSEVGSYLGRINFVYHSTLGLRVIKKKKKGWLAHFGLP
jgi:hypothetical protein